VKSTIEYVAIATEIWEIRTQFKERQKVSLRSPKNAKNSMSAQSKGATDRMNKS